MDRRLSILAICCLTALAVTSAPAKALPNPEPSGCGLICQNGDPCEGCRTFNGTSLVWTTCGQYWGRPANDLDGDGAIDTQDNCRCLANANQANCDGDAYGDACDFQDNSWARISVGTQRCLLDEDRGFPKITLEFYYQDVYRSSCTGQSCYRKYLRGSVQCNYWDDEFACCKSKWIPFTDCGGAWNTDQCGLPRCSF